MPVYVLLIWAIIGALVGWLGIRLLTTSGSLGQVGNSAVGAAGGVVSGYLVGLMGGKMGLSIVLAGLGAFAAIYLANKFFKK